jgi:hypothetical protein
MLEKSNGKDTAPILAQKEQIDQKITFLAALRKRDTLFKHFISMSLDFDKLGSDSIIYDFAQYGSAKYGWIYKDNKVTLVKDTIPDLSYTEFINTTLTDQSDKTKYNYIIVSSELDNNIQAIKSKKDAEGMSFPDFMYIYSALDVPEFNTITKSLYSDPLVVKKGIDYEVESDKDLLKYSVVIDDKSTDYELAQALFAGEVKPALLIKSKGDDSVDAANLIYYGALYNKVANIVFHSVGSSNIVKNGSYFGGTDSFDTLNNIAVTGTSYIALGKPGVIGFQESRDLYTRNPLLASPRAPSSLYFLILSRWYSRIFIASKSSSSPIALF